MDNFNDFLYVRAKAIMKDEKEARQLMKDVFVDESNPKDAYRQLYKKGSHRFITKLNREAKEMELWDEDAVAMTEISKEKLGDIGDVLELLPDLFFATLFACCYDGMSVKEAAKVMECSEGNIRHRLNYSKKCIQDALGDEPFSMHVVSAAIDEWMVRYIASSEKAGVSEWSNLVVPMPKKMKKQLAQQEKVEEPVIEENIVEEAASEEPEVVEEQQQSKSPIGKVLLAVAVLALLVGGGYVASQYIEWPQDTPVVDTPVTEPETQLPQEQVPQEQVVQEPVVQEPVVQEQVVQEQMVQEPVAEESAVEKTEKSEYIFANSDKKLLTKKQLRKYTKKQLRLARNEIYARYGVKFDDKELNAHFSSMSWYEPKITIDEFYDTLELNYIEEKNVALIREIEREK